MIFVLFSKAISNITIFIVYAPIFISAIYMILLNENPIN